MLLTALVCILIGFANSQSISSTTCGKRPLKPFRDDDKIVGGVESTRGDWPWSCSMRYNQRHICGGSLINNKWIITAAHCVSSTVASSYRWICGAHERLRNDSWTQEFVSTRVVVHPNYNSRLIQNDIALFQISSAGVSFTNYVMPACFPSASNAYAGQTSWASGWGTTSSGGTIAAAQREVAMPVLTDAACKSKFGGTNNMLDPVTQVCAGVSGGNKDTCQGDSGGPLVVQHSDGDWYLIGLTSWGYGCGDGGVYTRTSAYRGWVEGYTGSGTLLGSSG